MADIELLPFHAFGFGDVLVTYEDSAHQLTVNKGHLAPDDFTPANFAAMNTASCFVLEKVDGQMMIEHKKVTAIMATAGHVAKDIVSQDQMTKDRCRFNIPGTPVELTTRYELYLVKEFVDGGRDIDSVSGYGYAMPGDLSLYALMECPLTLTVFPPSNQITVDMPARAIGYPGTPHDIRYLLPTLPGRATESQIANCVRENMGAVREMIYTDGKVLADLYSGDRHLGAASYSATVGMSGAPVINEATRELLGLHLGAPSLSGHEQLSQLIQAMRNRQSIEIQRLTVVMDGLFSGLSPEFQSRYQEMKDEAFRGRNASNLAASLLYSRVYADEQHRERVNYNQFMPVTHPAFIKAYKIAEHFKHCDTDFTSDAIRAAADSV